MVSACFRLDAVLLSAASQRSANASVLPKEDVAHCVTKKKALSRKYESAVLIHSIAA